MNKIIITIACTVLSMCLSIRDAKAQFVLGISGEFASFPTVEGLHAGGAVVIGRQMKLAFVQAEIGYNPAAIHCDLSYFLRIYGNKQHSFNMYLGAGLTGIYEHGRRGSNRIMAGAFPAIEAETFVSKRISLYADARTPFFFLSHEMEPCVRFSLGVRFLIYQEDSDE